MATVSAPPQKAAADSLRIHVFLGVAVAVMLAIGIIGCASTRVHYSLRGMALFYIVVAGMLFLPVAYAHRAGYERTRDVICFLFWAKVISQAIVPCVYFAARMRFPLRDASLGSIDRAMGVNIGAIHAWSESHRAAAAVINFTYPRLLIYLIATIVLGIALRHSRKIREFFVANVLGLLLMLPLFALVPAVGPWTVYHFPPSVWQVECQRDFLLLRTSGPVLNPGFAGVIAFPSLHVFWAVICADTLYPNRWLRVPIIVFSMLIIVSTMTMGWHYFSDVLAGLVLAVFCIAAARRLVNRGMLVSSTQ